MNDNSGSMDTLNVSDQNRFEIYINDAKYLDQAKILLQEQFPGICSKEEKFQHIIMCIDAWTEQVAGVLMFVFARDVSTLTYFRKLYLLDQFTPDFLKKSALIQALAVTKEYRSRDISDLLFKTITQYLISQDVHLALFFCTPGLFRLYAGIGAFILGHIAEPEYGAVKMFGALTAVITGKKLLNLDHFSRSATQFHEQINNLTLTHQIFKIFPEYEITYLKENKLLKGLSHEAIQTVLKDTIQGSYKKNDLIASKLEVVGSAGLIKKGSVMLKIDESITTFLSANDFFGLSYLLGDYSAYDIIAAEDGTEIVFLGIHTLKKIISENDANKIDVNIYNGV